MQRKRQVILLVLISMVLLFLNLNSSYFIEAMRKLAYKPLAGAVIVLDAGHGGRDDGARADKVKEQEINLLITKKCQKLFEAAGAEVILTRKDDKDLSSEYAKNHKQEDMKNRIQIINEEKSDLMISIHLNSYGNTSVHGAQSFYMKDHVASLELANSIQSYFRSELTSKMLPKPGDYYLLNYAKIPSVLLECGFLSNPQEREKLKDDQYQDKIAQAIFAGVIDYFEKMNYN